MNSMWSGKTVLLTGGTGFLGQFLSGYLKDKAEKVLCYARDPHKHEAMQRTHPHVRPFVGDVRDKQRLDMAMEHADICVHAAAMKSVPMCEYNPADADSINVVGTLNVLNSARLHNTQTVFISSDKAVEPVNLYGKTKALAEHMTLAYNAYSPGLFSAVRYGNVMGSTGSVVPLWRDWPEDKPLQLTSRLMTRFWVEPIEAVWLIEDALDNPGKLIVGSHPGFWVKDLAEVMAGQRKIEEVGERQGEKLHETLIGEHEGIELTSDGSWWLSKEEINERLHSLYETQSSNGRGREIRRESPTVLSPYTWPTH
jgi:UDP-N-acetylglucosamine 4,6-dehydratase